MLLGIEDGIDDGIPLGFDVGRRLGLDDGLLLGETLGLMDSEGVDDAFNVGEIERDGERLGSREG